jgi:predicted TIM-barrel fold metal-dependent hydrolase
MAHGDDDPGLPIKLGPCGNGEFTPPPASPLVQEVERRAREAIERHARRTGMSRRRFLQTLSGAAVVLATLDACSNERHAARPSGSTSTSTPGGTFTVPTEATTEPAAASSVLAGGEFVMDVQGHLLDYVLVDGTRQLSDFGLGFPFAQCGESDPRACFTMEHFLEEVFLRSDTSTAVLSALPIEPGPGNPLSIDIMEMTRRVMLGLCQDERVLLHGQANPNLGDPAAALDAMTALAADHPIAAWKAYTHAPGPGWTLTNTIGDGFLERAVSLERPIVCVHKGVSGRSRFASPADVGPAAARHPDARLVVYHSGWEGGVVEGPYDASAPNGGVDRLIASVEGAGLGAGSNVYAELGTTWRSLMGDPTQAAHLLGKLLAHLGDDNVVWGTDSIWYGSPQDQIQAFRAFEITPEFQERFGYPALTPERKAKILGLNAARLYGVTPSTVACPFTRDELQSAREAVARPFRTYGPTSSLGS